MSIVKVKKFNPALGCDQDAVIIRCDSFAATLYADKEWNGDWTPDESSAVYVDHPTANCSASDLRGGLRGEVLRAIVVERLKQKTQPFVTYEQAFGQAIAELCAQAWANGWQTHYPDALGPALWLSPAGARRMGLPPSPFPSARSRGGALAGTVKHSYGRRIIAKPFERGPYIAGGAHSYSNSPAEKFVIRKEQCGQEGCPERCMGLCPPTILVPKIGSKWKHTADGSRFKITLHIHAPASEIEVVAVFWRGLGKDTELHGTISWEQWCTLIREGKIVEVVSSPSVKKEV